MNLCFGHTTADVMTLHYGHTTAVLILWTSVMDTQQLILWTSAIVTQQLIYYVMTLTVLVTQQLILWTSLMVTVILSAIHSWLAINSKGCQLTDWLIEGMCVWVKATSTFNTCCWDYRCTRPGKSFPAPAEAVPVSQHTEPSQPHQVIGICPETRVMDQHHQECECFTLLEFTCHTSQRRCDQSQSVSKMGNFHMGSRITAFNLDFVKRKPWSYVLDASCLTHIQ